MDIALEIPDNVVEEYFEEGTTPQDVADFVKRTVSFEIFTHGLHGSKIKRLDPDKTVGIEAKIV